MKIRILTLLFSAFIIGASYAHDDLVYRTASEWSFDAGNQSTISETYGSAFLGGAVVADYNGDGIPDICEIDTSGEEIRWIWKLGNGDNEWSNIEAITFGETATDKCAVGDFNGDGKADIAVMRSGSSLATWYIDYAPCDGQFDEQGIQSSRAIWLLMEFCSERRAIFLLWAILMAMGMTIWLCYEHWRAACWLIYMIERNLNMSIMPI